MHVTAPLDIKSYAGTIPMQASGLILGLRPGNKRRRYKATPSLIGSAQI